MDWHRSNETSKRLHYIPGVGPLLATALVVGVADSGTFRSGRNFSAWIGLGHGLAVTSESAPLRSQSWPDGVRLQQEVTRRQRREHSLRIGREDIRTHLQPAQLSARHARED
jgi:hypothetical protein